MNQAGRNTAPFHRAPRTGKLLFRFDPGRDLIHLKRGRVDVKIPLRR